MARVKAFYQVSASSLIEVTVSIVIIVMVLAMALTIYLNVTTSGSTLQQLRHRMCASDLAEQTKREREYLDEEIVVGNTRIQKKFSAYENNPQLMLMEVNVVDDSDSILYHRQELLHTNEQKD